MAPHMGRSWRIVEMDLWDRDAIDLVGPGFIELVVALIAAAHRPETIRSLAVFEPPAFALVAERLTCNRSS